MNTKLHASLSLLAGALSLAYIGFIAVSNHSPRDPFTPSQSHLERSSYGVKVNTLMAVPERAVTRRAPKRAYATVNTEQACTLHTLSQGNGTVTYCDSDREAVAAVYE